jgi:ATP-dependent exoDNAse (exonuclease V) beta subunit
MGQGTLTIYSASAGSGKTYKLTAIYLANLFSSRYNYRKILAVTFTNKATAEMKSRILDHLYKLSVGENSDYLPGLIKATKKTEEWIRREAKEVLNSILHDFSRFSVSTIDSFFQKVLRAFAREVGLHSGFNIELDHTTILSSAVDEMIGSAAVDAQLKNWLILMRKRVGILKMVSLSLQRSCLKKNSRCFPLTSAQNLKTKNSFWNILKRSNQFLIHLRDS